MTVRLVQEDLSSLDSERPILMFQRHDRLTVRTGDLLGKLLLLLLTKRLKGPFRHALSRRGGYFLHGGKIQARLRGDRFQCPTGSYFSPLTGKFLDLAEFFIAELGLSHGLACHTVTKMNAREFHCSL